MNLCPNCGEIHRGQDELCRKCRTRKRYNSLDEFREHPEMEDGGGWPDYAILYLKDTSRIDRATPLDSDYRPVFSRGRSTDEAMRITG